MSQLTWTCPPVVWRISVLERSVREKYLLLLEKIVSHWPKKGGEPDESLRSLLTEDFDETDFLNELDGVLRVLDVEEPEDGVVDIDFQDNTGDPHRAHFVGGHRSARLKWLKFECPGCFGGKLTDKETCILCDGLGWGAGR